MDRGCAGGSGVSLLLYDISGMFGYPLLSDVYEYNLRQNKYYDGHRRKLLETLGDKYNIVGLKNGEKVSHQEYYDKMFQCKIVISPIGAGEMNPRDIQSAQNGSVLIEPDMSYIKSKPFIYEDGETYIACKYDWSDLEEKIDYVLDNYIELREYLVQNMRKRYLEQYSFINFTKYIHNTFKNLEGVAEHA